MGMDEIAAALTLAVAAATAWVGVRRLGTWPDRATAASAGVVIGTTCLALAAQAEELLRRALGPSRLPGLVAPAAQVELLAVALALVGFRCGRLGDGKSAWRTGARPGRGAGGFGRRPAGGYVAAAGILALSLGLQGAGALTDGPTDRGGHLGVAVRWLQDGAMPPRAAGNAEVLLVRLLGTGQAHAAAAVGLVGGALAAAATASLARRASGSVTATHASLAALLFLSAPAVQGDLFRADGALLGGGFWLSGLAFFLARRDPAPDAGAGRWYATAVGLAGAACGLSAGTASRFAAVDGALLLAASAVVAWEARSDRRAALRRVAALAAGVLLTCGYRLLAGLPAEWEASGPPTAALPTAGAAWSTFVPLGVLYGLARAVRGRRLARAAGAIAVAGFVAAQGLQRPDDATTLAALALGAAASAPLLARLDRSRTRLFPGLLVLAVGLSCVGPAGAVLLRLRTDRGDRAARLGYAPYLDDLPPGSVVLEMSGADSRAFALAGRWLTNRVMPRRRLGRPLRREALAAAGVDYVYDTPPFAVGELAAAGAWPILSGESDARPDGRWVIWKVDRPR